jgi:septal ring-binding cell division protein DamX
MAHVKAAVRDSEFSDVPAPRVLTPIAYALGGLAVGGAIGAAAFAAYLGFSGDTQRPPLPVAEAPVPTENRAETSSPSPGSAQLDAEPIVAVNAPADMTGIPVDLLEQRLLATDEWVNQQGPRTLTIQLLGTNDPELLRDYLKTIAKYLEIEKVYVYRTVANQRPSLTVLYGAFNDRFEVIRTLESLPGDMKANRPYTRTIQGVRAEIARNRS